MVVLFLRKPGCLLKLAVISLRTHVYFLVVEQLGKLVIPRKRWSDSDDYSLHQPASKQMHKGTFRLREAWMWKARFSGQGLHKVSQPLLCGQSWPGRSLSWRGSGGAVLFSIPDLCSLDVNSNPSNQKCFQALAKCPPGANCLCLRTTE